MIKFLSQGINYVFLLLVPWVINAQGPNLGTSASFSLFTSTGFINNVGSTTVIGDLGINVGTLAGFPPGVVLGNTHVSDPVSAQAAIDVGLAYNALAGFPCGLSIGSNLGNGQILTANTYCLSSNAFLDGTLILDGQCNPNAYFIFIINGAFSTSAAANISLINNASNCNIYWLVNGAVHVGSNSVVRGNFLINGPIFLDIGVSVLGRALTIGGNVNLNTNYIDIDGSPEASTISASGPTALCNGDSVVLSGNCGGVWSTGQTTPTITVSLAGNYFVNNTNLCGAATSNVINVSLGLGPNCLITGAPTFCLGLSTTLCAQAGLGTYLWNTGATTNCITVSVGGTYSVTVTDSAGCSSVCSQLVTELPNPICIITGDSLICDGQSTILSVQAGYASYLWSNGETTNTITVTLPGIYSVTVIDIFGCSNFCSITVDLNAGPICNITGDTLTCDGQSTILSTQAGYASYLWSNGGTTNTITVDLPGIYSVIVTDLAGCTSTCSIEIFVGGQPLCNIIGKDNFCNNAEMITLCGITGASSYLWSTGETSQCISLGSVGTYTLTVTNAAGCTSSCSKTLGISPYQNCIITGDSTICALGQTIEICAAPGASLYWWSTGATTNCITVSAPGTYSLTVTNADGCLSFCSRTITIDSLPACQITGPDFICNLGQNISICVPAGNNTYLWNTGATTNCITVNVPGTYSVSVTNSIGCVSVCSKIVELRIPQIARIIGSTVICPGQISQLCAFPTGMNYLWNNGDTTECIDVNNIGTYSLTVTNNDGCTSVASIIITSGVPPLCLISGIQDICEGDSTTLCVTVGGSYRWSNGAISSCISVGVAGTYSVTVTNSIGCESICSIYVNVHLAPVCTISGENSICQLGQSIEICGIPLTGTYLWSTGQTSRCITINQAGTYTLTITNEFGCESVCNKVITLDSTPICIITGIEEFCEGSFTTLCATLGNSYLWSTGDTSSCITVGVSGTYSVTVTSVNGCESICSTNVFVQLNPVCIISGPNSICQSGQSIEICGFPVTGTYLWNTGQTSRCITINQAGTYTVTITNEFGCVSICNKVITLDSTPVCLITGDDFICEIGRTANLCVPTGALSYLWSTGQNTNCITVDTAGTFTVTVTHFNGCVSVCSKTITVNSNPVCSISGNPILCEIGSTTQLCVTAGALSYLWNNGQTTNCINVNTAGTYSVTVTYSDSCTSTCSIVVSQQTPANCIITGDSSICESGQTINLCVPAGALAYAWSTGSINRCIDVNLAGTYSVTVTYVNGCTTSCSRVITLDSIPQCIISGNDLLCGPGSTTVLCSNVEANEYLWSTGDTTRCITVNQGGIYSLTITNDNDCTTNCSRVVNTNSVTPCEISGNRYICNGDSISLCATPDSANYVWSTGDTTSCITAGISGTYTVTITDENGCTSACSVVVQDTTFAACLISGSTTIINGQATQLCAPINWASYDWSTGDTTRCILVSTPGTYSVTVTNINGCVSICSVVVIETLPLPDTCLITGVLRVCQAQPTLLCAPQNSGSYQWSTGATTACILAKTPGTYSLTVTNINGTVNICSANVLLDVVPTCLIRGNTTVCAGKPTMLCIDPIYKSYRWSTGDTSNCIMVSGAGTYSVTLTNASGCESTCSVCVTETIAPSCLITGNNTINPGQFTVLCAPPNYAGYSWSDGSKTACMVAWTGGMYTVTVTDQNGCTSSCCFEVFALLPTDCLIRGVDSTCFGQPALLCGPIGCASYLWSNGARTSCITINSPGTYTLTTIDSFGTQRTCEHTVYFKSPPTCSITGLDTICIGGTTVLCTPLLTGAKYLWNTGDTNNCILVDTAGIFSVTVTLNGCSSSCSIAVSFGSGPISKISGNLTPAFGKNTLLCSTPDQKSYLWNTGAITSCINATSGMYSVTVTNAQGCVSNSWARVLPLNTNTAWTGINSSERSNGKVLINIFPNPTDSKATIEILNLVADVPVNVELYTLSGAKVSNLFEQVKHRENNSSMVLNAVDLSEGIYICRIIHGDEIVNKRITIVR